MAQLNTACLFKIKNSDNVLRNRTRKSKDKKSVNVYNDKAEGLEIKKDTF